MLDTFLQFGMLMRARVIPFGSPEHSQLQILIQVIPIVFKCNLGHRPPLIIWMLRHMWGGTPLVVTSRVRTEGLIRFGATRIVSWMHGFLGFERRL